MDEHIIKVKTVGMSLAKKIAILVPVVAGSLAIAVNFPKFSDLLRDAKPAVAFSNFYITPGERGKNTEFKLTLVKMRPCQNKSVIMVVKDSKGKEFPVITTWSGVTLPADNVEKDVTFEFVVPAKMADGNVQSAQLVATHYLCSDGPDPMTTAKVTVRDVPILKDGQ